MIAYSLPVILIGVPTQPVDCCRLLSYVFCKNWINVICHFSSKLIEGRFQLLLEGRILIYDNPQSVSRPEWRYV
jgi:hypothetical protein